MSSKRKRAEHCPGELRLTGALCGLAGLVLAGRAEAELDLARLAASVARTGQTVDALPPALLGRSSRSVSMLVERHGNARVPERAIPIHGDWFALEVEKSELDALSALPGLTLHWAPARRLLIDRALAWSRVEEFRAAGGGTGKGVVVGFVDTGVDTFHPDFENPDGSTRIRWLIDFTRPPAGLQPELEQQFGCNVHDSCAIYSGSDIDQLLVNTISGDEPRDTVGHGTHVASLATGNGRSSEPARFAGVAPEADLVVARVTGGEVGIFDDLVARGVSFVFERADSLGEPAVLNLSLGSDLGAHDGSSALERALSSFIGPEQPGHAIVVAAGNSAGLLANGNSPFPGPLGIHTEIHVPRESPAWVPLLTPYQGRPTTHATIKIWISTRPGDALEIGLERAGELVGALTPPDSFSSAVSDGVRVAILNGVGASFGDRVPSEACLLIIDGEWPAGETFALRFGGHGSASMWLTGEGDLDPQISAGPLFPQSQKEGTINVPASAPDLIAVGASVNRTEWTDWEGNLVSHPENGSSDAPADSSAYYSAAGPSARGVLKPDIVAPGTNIIGAMSAPTDPRLGRFSMFSGKGSCTGDRECFVVDDFHAVSSGTSMAAPIVAGAIALLFERDPSLTQNQVRALLQAGARSLTGTAPIAQQLGVGALDLQGTLDAQRSLDSPLGRLPGKTSWLALASSYAHPDEAWPLEGYAELRDDEGRLADALDPRDLALRVVGATLSEPLTRVAPAFYRFAVTAPAGTGGASLQLTLEFRGQTLATRDVTIAVDPGVAHGVPQARGGGCSIARRRDSPWQTVVIFGALALVSAAVRRRRNGGLPDHAGAGVRLRAIVASASAKRS